MEQIYKATCLITQKCYIGYTKRALKERINHHKWDAFTRQANTKFHHALRKHGMENFTWETIYMSQEPNYCLTVMENYFIKEFDSIKNGYNSMEGGWRGPTLCGAANGMFGRTHTQEMREAQGERARLALSGKSYEEIHGQARATQLRTQRSLQRHADTRGSLNPRARHIEIVTPQGEHIQCHGDFKATCRQLGLSYTTMNEVLKGYQPQRGTCMGYTARYK